MGPQDDDAYPHGENSEGQLVVPAWYDPKARRVVFDPSTILVGVLALDAENLAYITDSGIQFAGRLADATATWPGFARLTRGCDLMLNGARHRLYFAKPLDGAPSASESQLTKIADAASSPLVELAGIFSSSAAILKPLVALPGAIIDQRQGIRNGDAVRERLEAMAHRP